MLLNQKTKKQGFMEHSWHFRAGHLASYYSSSYA